MLDNPVFNHLVARRLGHQIDAGLGSLWWVSEREWEKVLPQRFHSDRKKHPALSILRRGGVPQLAERVPVLYGTSKRHTKSVVVEGLSEERGDAYRAFFIHIAARPAFAFATFDQEEMVDSASGLPPIWPNRHKPRVNDSEMADLNAFLQRRGLL